MKKYILTAFLFSLFLGLEAGQLEKSVLLQTLEQELQRCNRILTEKADPKPYFLSYHVTEIDQMSVHGTLGALKQSFRNRSRRLDIDVRVGDYQLDSTHRTQDPRGAFSRADFPQSVEIPLEDDPDAIRSAIWLETERRYRSATERYIKIKGNQAVAIEAEDKSADFSRETPRQAMMQLAAISPDVSEWEKRIKSYSSFFRQYPEILDSFVELSAFSANKYFVNSEGTSIQFGAPHFRLSIYATTKAEDGMDLDRFEAFTTRSEAGLPDDLLIRQSLQKIVDDLKALKAARVVEPYTGPAILSGRASGVFFHEIFGHRIEGHRQKDEKEGQTFSKKINEIVLPDFISVIDDPTQKKWQEIDLNGSYSFDDEGVQSERVEVVKNGVLRNFLMSRSPVAGFEKSNGHGRRSPGRSATGRQGNLIVSASNMVSREELRKMLIDECKKQDKPYGLLFDDIQGGFTMTSRAAPQAFQVTPVMVYRVFADGRPDELVRGVDLIGTPLTSFSKIVAADDQVEVFNGNCGAESGWVPVAAVSPAILTSQIEIQKKAKSSERLPVLPSPLEEDLK